jgi:hypothetical protein
MAADSLRVHSSMTVCRISFMKSMKALSGFLIFGGRFGSWAADDGDGGWGAPYGGCTASG